MRHPVWKGILVACLVAGVAFAMPPAQWTWLRFMARLAATAQTRATIAAPATGTAVPTPRNDSRPKVVPVNLTLTGTIDGLPDGVPVDGVEATIGGRNVVAAVNGRTYTVATGLARADDMVAVTVRAPSIRFRAVVGTMRRLKRQSAGDGVVSVTEAPALRVGPFSSAIAITTRSLLGRDVASDLELERTLQRINGYDLAGVAYMLGAYADGTASLPSGFATGYDVASDETALAAALSPITHGDHRWFPAFTAYMAELPAASPLRATGELARRTFARSASVPGELTFVANAAMLSRRDDGRFEFVDENATPDTVYTAQIVAGALQMTPLHAPTPLRQDYPPFSPGQRTTVQRTLRSVEWRRMSDGDVVDLWSLVYRWTESYPEYPSQPAVEVSTVDLLTATDFDAAIRKDVWSALEGQRWTLPRNCFADSTGVSDIRFDACDVSIHRFDPGGAGMTEDVGYKVNAQMLPQQGTYGAPFAWSQRTDGGLDVTSGTDAATYWAVDAIPGVALMAYTVTRQVDGMQGTALNISLAVQVASVPFGTAQVPGTWASGSIVAWAPRYPADGYALSLVRNADGTGDSIQTYNGTTSHAVQTWSVVGERLYETRVRAQMPTGSQYVTSCSFAFANGATACAPVRVRYLRPLRRVGNRLYGIQEFAIQSVLKPEGYTGTYDITYAVQAVFQECLSGDCLASAAWAPALEYPRHVPIASATESFRSRYHDADLRVRLR